MYVYWGKFIISGVVSQLLNKNMSLVDQILSDL